MFLCLLSFDLCLVVPIVRWQLLYYIILYYIILYKTYFYENYIFFCIIIAPKKSYKKRLLGDFLQEIICSDFLHKNVMFNLSHFLCINCEIY